MVNQERGTVNTSVTPKIEGEEIMVPYNKVFMISWDLEAGAKLKKIRLEKGITRPQLERMSNGAFSRDTVKSLEYGRKNAVSREIIDSILTLLDSDISSIFPTVSVNFSSFSSWQGYCQYPIMDT